jgi:hypothetical protein
MILPPPLLRDADGTLRLGPARIEALDAPQGLALLLCGHRLTEDGRIEPLEGGTDLPMPLGTLRGPAKTLPDRWTTGFAPDLQRLLGQILEAAALLLPRGHGGRLQDACMVAPERSAPFPLLPQDPSLPARLLERAFARAGSLVCHADRPLPLPAPPDSAHARLRRTQALLAAVAHPGLADALRRRLADG